MLLLVGILVGMWGQTLVQDADGYYQIGTAADWEAFATLVVTNPTANAKMTADIDLGESQAMLGDSEHEDNPTYAYQGTFDGQGHTLTVHYTGTSQTAPFAMLQKATIRNIHVDGTINNTSGDRAVTITDAVSMVNYILGRPGKCLWMRQDVPLGEQGADVVSVTLSTLGWRKKWGKRKSRFRKGIFLKEANAIEYATFRTEFVPTPCFFHFVGRLDIDAFKRQLYHKNTTLTFLSLNSASSSFFHSCLC